MTSIETDARLLKRLKDAAKDQLTPEELDRQRVSFILGSVGDRSSITEERVRDVLNKQEGRKIKA